MREEEEVPAPRQKLLPYVEVPRLKEVQKAKAAAVAEPIPVTTRQGPAYKHQAPIEKEPLNKQDIMKRLDNTKIEITQGELLRMATPVRKDYVKHLTPKRVPSSPQVTVSTLATEEPEVSTEPDSQSASAEIEYVDIRSLPMAGMYILEEADGDLPRGAIVLEDPVEQYINSLEDHQEPVRIIAASESQSLKALYPVINGVGTKESLIDGGSQIVSMSLAAATELKLSWDPRVIIHMQSANRQVVPTEGLARNVPFLFNEITVYLQVHILRHVAYQVLLGRPWEVLTACNIKNHPDGSQVVTLTDPNTKEMCAMPSYDRGRPPAILTKMPAPASTNFQQSMN